MQRYIIHESSEESYDAGTKATKDCEEILLKKGFQKINVCTYQGKRGLWPKLKKRLQVIKFFRIKKEAIVVVHHPIYIGAAYMRMLKIIKSLKKIKLIFIIHDLESLRKIFEEYERLFDFWDNTMFQIGDALIAHNKRMTEYLVKEKKVDENKVVTLGLFDYLAEKRETIRENEHTDTEIVIAGNLAPTKSEYIYKLRKSTMNLEFVLYGPNYDSSDSEKENWKYKGVFSPTEIVSALQGDYGLVWDGDDLMSCAGNTGNYLRYNNPHKVSLYIAAELPIIIWEQAALAEYVVSENIGIKIDSLETLEDAVHAVSKEEYMRMKENIKKISERVRKGDFFDEAYTKAEKIVIG